MEQPVSQTKKSAEGAHWSSMLQRPPNFLACCEETLQQYQQVDYAAAKIQELQLLAHEHRCWTTRRCACVLAGHSSLNLTQAVRMRLRRCGVCARLACRCTSETTMNLFSNTLPRQRSAIWQLDECKMGPKQSRHRNLQLLRSSNAKIPRISCSDQMSA